MNRAERKAVNSVRDAYNLLSKTMAEMSSAALNCRLAGINDTAEVLEATVEAMQRKSSEYTDMLCNR